MTLRQRPYMGERDWPAIADLIAADLAFQHRVDFPWRLCSTSLENHQNVAVWESEEGQMQIFAALQFPWLTLDYAIAPDIRTWDIEAVVIVGLKRVCRRLPQKQTAISHSMSAPLPTNGHASRFWRDLATPVGIIMWSF